MRKMRDSGIEWIGAIPQDWKTDRLQWHLKEINVSNNPIQTKNILSLTIEAGVIPYAEKGNQGNKAKEDYSQYKIAFPDTLVINSMNVIIGAVGISQYFGCVSPVYYVFEPIEGTDLRYIYYLFTNTGFQKEMRKYAKGILEIRLRISSNDMLKRIVPSPPFKEQQRIADYLNKMCAEIDTVLEKTRASIEEYKKLKQAVITQAVTKGIRGDRPMKDSGSVWFEEIPCNWVMKRIKYLFHIKKDIAGKEGYTVLSITQRGIQPKDLSKNEGQIAANYSQYQLLAPGDFAMNHMDLLTGWVDISKYSGVTSPDYRVFVLDDTEKNDSSYYLYLMQMCYFNRIFYGLGQGVSGMGRWRLQADKFMNFPVVVPPVDEQKEIVSYLNEKCKQLDTLIRNKQQYLTEIENYKKSLIYEYVTGKKEVKTSVLAD